MFEFVVNHRGAILSMLIVVATIIEIIAYYYSNPDYFSSVAKNKSGTSERATTHQGRALTLISAVFAIVTFAVTTSNESSVVIEPSMILLATSAGLLLVSYQAKNLTQTKEIWLIIQETTLEQGFISFIIGLILLFLIVVPIAGAVIALTALVVVPLRYYPVYRELRMYRRMYNSTKNRVLIVDCDSSQCSNKKKK